MRYRVLYFIVAFCCFMSFTRLIDLQLVHGDEYQQMSHERIVKTTAVAAPRGEILDRNGKPLVKNKTGFSIELHYIKGRKEPELNALICALCTLLEENGKRVVFSFPVSEENHFTLSDDDILAWKKEKNFSEIATVDEVLDFYSKQYKVDDTYTPFQKRDIIGVRYEMERTGFSANTPYVFAEDIGEVLLAKIKEKNNQYPGVVVSAAPVRQYVEGSAAAHILGRTGKIYKEEYEELKDQNYSMSDIIGKQGIEKCFEQYLRGTDGISGVEQSLDGRRVKLIESVVPKPGNNVVLTLDVKLQKTAEQALSDTISMIKNKSGEGPGYDAESGALVAIDVNTGDILAMASYPTYNPIYFNVDYEKLSHDKNLPMFNRAIGGAYEPGSTFKMLTAIAALEEGVITPNDYIEDKGIYEYYDDYQPACWIFRSKKVTHGYQNVSEAIENSCNYFFYDIGRRTGIENIDKYARLAGLGEATGIELSAEENTGRLASPEAREKNGGVWNPGDTLQTAIGQSDNMFTPLQIANYLATIVNGGTRYKTHIVKNVRSPENGKLLYEAKPEVVSKIEMKPENYRAVMEGMRNVLELGTASDVFDGFNISAGGKTGTAEVSGGSDNAIFVGFAPFDNPAIAVCAVVEHGAHGASAGYAVRAVLEEYFNTSETPRLVEKKNAFTR